MPTSNLSADPLAYFITFSCYGTWLHGDERGSVDDEHNRYGDDLFPADHALNTARRSRLGDPPYLLDASRRELVLRAIREIADRPGWRLLAVHVRSNHVHIVVTADRSVERVMNDFKAAASQRLNRSFPDECDRKRWTRHGSTRYLWTDDQVAAKVEYTLFGQGEAMQRFPDSDGRGSDGAAHGASLRAE